MDIITHAGRRIRFREMTAKTHVPRYCVICNKSILTGQQIYSVMCMGPNGPFPNVTIHKACIHPPPAPFEKNNSFTWGAAKLHELWKEAQTYRWWFDHEY